MSAFLRTLGPIIAAATIGSSAVAQFTPRVAVLPDGATVPDAEVDDEDVIHVAYLSGGDIYYVRSSDEGATFSKPLRVNTEPGFASGGRFRGPDLAVGRNGCLHVIWYNAGYQQKRPHHEWGVMYSRLERGSREFQPARNLNGRPSDNFSLAADRDGRVAVVWMAGGIFANFSNDDGASFAEPVDLKLDPCECCGSRALYGSDGRLAVLYRDKTDNLRDTNLARWDPERARCTTRRISETPWPITSCPMTGGFLTAAGSGLAAAWETKGQPYFALLPESPRKATPSEVRAAKAGRYPVVLASPDRPTLVAWKNESLLEWQAFDSEGNPIGPPGRHSATTADRPAGVLTRTGTFVLFP